eukprot:6712597-Alexandrium_andersonii.AAC.1
MMIPALVLCSSAYTVAYLSACSGGPWRDWTRGQGGCFILGMMTYALVLHASSRFPPIALARSGLAQPGVLDSCRAPLHLRAHRPPAW